MTVESSTPETAAACRHGLTRNPIGGGDEECSECGAVISTAGMLAVRDIIDNHHCEWLDGEIAYAETDALLERLERAGFTVVSGGEGLQHGDAHEREWYEVYDVLHEALDVNDDYDASRDYCNDTTHAVFAAIRRAAGATAPETTPAACPDCGGHGVRVNPWATEQEALEGLNVAQCPSCAGSGVAETTP